MVLLQTVYRLRHIDLHLPAKSPTAGASVGATVCGTTSIAGVSGGSRRYKNNSYSGAENCQNARLRPLWTENPSGVPFCCPAHSKPASLGLCGRRRVCDGAGLSSEIPKMQSARRGVCDGALNVVPGTTLFWGSQARTRWGTKFALQTGT